MQGSRRRGRRYAGMVDDAGIWCAGCDVTVGDLVHVVEAAKRTKRTLKLAKVLSPNVEGVGGDLPCRVVTPRRLGKGVS